MSRKIDKWFNTLWVKAQLKRPQSRAGFFLAFVVSYFFPLALTFLGGILLVTALVDLREITHPIKAIGISTIGLVLGLLLVLLGYKEDKRKGYVDSLYQGYLNRIETLKKDLDGDK